MASLVLLSLVATVVSQATKTFPATPLASKSFTYPSGIPYKVDTDTDLVRGVQHGYNICNSTTQNQNSLCQTGFINSLQDFCLWGTPEPASDVGSSEGEMVAWCTQPGKGTRLIPEGALQGVQFMRTPAYIQVSGFIDQTKINIAAGVEGGGGEMDPHGADLRGNPLGGLMFTNAWSGNPDQYTQAIEWHNFLGNNGFCFKLCDPRNANAANFCEHRFDRIGCEFNAPARVENGTFTSCEGENQDFPGTYTTNGQVMTYTQPPEALGPIQTMPYTARLPNSSNCQTFTSSQIYAALATGAPSSPSNTASGGSSASGGNSASGSPTNTGANGQPTSGATAISISGLAVMAIVGSALFLS